MGGETLTTQEAIRHLDTYSSTNGSGLTTQDQHEEAKRMAIEALSGTDTNVGTNDLISRQAAIDALTKHLRKTDVPESYPGIISALTEWLNELLPAQPTLYGYNIRHLELIAKVLQKENLPPERVAEVLMDIGRIVAIVTDEVEETLRKSVEQSMDFAVGEGKENRWMT